LVFDDANDCIDSSAVYGWPVDLNQTKARTMRVGDADGSSVWILTCVNRRPGSS